ncbi:MAG: RDD family protein [Methylovulum sp.]
MRKLSSSASAMSPGFLTRLSALFYDSILLLALFFLATALLLPFNNGQAFTGHDYYYPCYLLAVSFIFYGWFWTHGGQTLGLKAWKIKVLTLDKKPLNWKQALIRFLATLLSWSVFGLGFLWILVDKNRLSWHDHLSNTAVFYDT